MNEETETPDPLSAFVARMRRWAKMGLTVNTGYVADKIEAALSVPARNCDVGTANDLHAAFVRHCDACNPPGGCCHRKDVRGMLSVNCASILKCFARFAIATAEGGGEK